MQVQRPKSAFDVQFGFSGKAKNLEKTSQGRTKFLSAANLYFQAFNATFDHMLIPIWFPKPFQNPSSKLLQTLKIVLRKRYDPVSGILL